MTRNAPPLATPAGLEQAPPVGRRTRADVRTVPFDYVVTFPIEGVRGARHQNIINVSTVGPFVVTAIGYSLLLDMHFGPVERQEEGVQGPTVPVAVLSSRGLTVSGTPGARLSLVVDGDVCGELQLNEQGHLEIDVPEGSSLFVLDPARERSSPLLRFSEDLFPPQFGPTSPSAGADRLEVAGTAGRRVHVELRGTRDAERRFPNIPPLNVSRVDGLLLSGDVTLPIEPPATDAARALAEEHGIDLATVVPTGANGDIICWDVVPLVKAGRTTGDRVPPAKAGVAVVPLKGLAAADELAELEDALGKAGMSSEEIANAFRRLAPGDRLLIRDAGSASSTSPSSAVEGEDPRRDLAATYQIAASPLGLRLVDLPAHALKHGFRLSRSVFEKLRDGIEIPPDELLVPFQRCGGGCEGFDFLYSIVDNATQRAFQNEPIHNVAGLGIANGDRPFRQLPKPIVFEPRSVIRFEIEEISGGPGTLYIVLQGYKVVGAGGDRGA